MALALKVETNRAADAVKAFAASQASTDLTAQSGCPACAPQYLVLYNLSAASAVITSGITLVPEDPTSPSMTAVGIPANGTLEVCVPIKTLTTPANVTAIAYWWDNGQVAIRQHVVPRNP